MRISDWSSDVCSSDLLARSQGVRDAPRRLQAQDGKRFSPIARAWRQCRPLSVVWSVAMIDILQKKFRDYGAAHAVEEENATKDIIQKTAHYAIWRAAFFNVVLFQTSDERRVGTECVCKGRSRWA